MYFYAFMMCLYVFAGRVLTNKHVFMMCFDVFVIFIGLIKETYVEAYNEVQLNLENLSTPQEAYEMTQMTQMTPESIFQFYTVFIASKLDSDPEVTESKTEKILKYTFRTPWTANLKFVDILTSIVHSMLDISFDSGCLTTTPKPTTTTKITTTTTRTITTITSENETLCWCIESNKTNSESIILDSYDDISNCTETQIVICNDTDLISEKSGPNNKPIKATTTEIVLNCATLNSPEYYESNFNNCLNQVNKYQLYRKHIKKQVNSKKLQNHLETQQKTETNIKTHQKHIKTHKTNTIHQNTTKTSIHQYIKKQYIKSAPIHKNPLKHHDILIHKSTQKYTSERQKHMTHQYTNTSKHTNTQKYTSKRHQTTPKDNEIFLEIFMCSEPIYESYEVHDSIGTCLEKFTSNWLERIHRNAWC
jgi:hypothetical protein